MRRVWRFFSSVYLTIVLAAVICMVAAWGSIVAMRNPRLFRAFDQEVLFPLLSSLGPEYLSLTLWVWALIVLTAVFALNTVVCTVDKVWSVLSSRKPWPSLFPHLVHIGFLIALLGHLVGSVWGFRSYGHVLFKGDVLAVPHEKGLYVRLDETETRALPTGELDYLRTGLTLLGEDGSEIRSADIGLNSPLIHKGVAFYHFDQGHSPTGLMLEVGGRRFEAGPGSAFTAPDGGSFRLGALYPDFALDETGRPHNRTGQYANPHIEIIAPDGSASYLAISAPGSSVVAQGVEIRLAGYAYTPYVVLTINKDPGITYIIVGSIVLVAGMLLLLFFRGDRAELVRARPEPEKGDH